MEKQTRKILILTFLFIGSFSACSTTELNETTIKVPLLTPMVLQTATTSPTPTPTAIPTSIRPSIPAPAVPDVSAPISVENAGQLTRLTALGEGDLVSMQLSPDEKWLALNTSNGVLLLNAATLEKEVFLPTEMRSYEIAFLEGGSELSARDCYQGYIWSIPDGRLVRHVKFLQQDPNSSLLPFCRSKPDSKWEKVFVLNSDGQKTGLYDIEDGTPIYTLDYDARNAVLSPDEKLVALYTSEKIVFLQYSDGKILKEIAEPGIGWLFFYPDGKTLGVVEGTLTKFWDVGDFQVIDTVNGTGLGSPLYTFPEFSPDGSVLVFRNGDNFRLIRSEDRLYINTVTGFGLKFTSDSQGFIVDNGFGQVTSYSFSEDRSNATANNSFSAGGFGEWVYYHSSIPGVFSSDNSKLLLIKINGSYTDVYGDFLDEILIYDLITDEKTHIDVDNSSVLTNAVWLPAMNTFGVLLKTIWSHDFYLVDLETKSLTQLLGGDWTNFYNAISFSPQSDLLVFAQGNRLFSWDFLNDGYWKLPIEAIELPHTLLRPNISFSPGSKEILFSDINNVAQVFDSEDYSSLGQREGSSQAYDDVSVLSPDGLYSAKISVDYGSNSVLVSDVVTGNDIISIGGYNTAFAFSPDSKMIAVSIFTTYSNIVSIYGLPAGNELFTTGYYFCEGDYAPKVAFSPDGKFFAILPLYGYPQIWGIP